MEPHLAPHPNAPMVAVLDRYPRPAIGAAPPAEPDQLARNNVRRPGGLPARRAARTETVGPLAR
eukprot:2557663-Lingulodinium_polyedra.AAC.1